MTANKHMVFLSNNYQLISDQTENTNTFVFHESGPAVFAKWASKTINRNNGCFIVKDYNNAILEQCERDLQKRNYYIDKVNMSSPNIHINPFDISNNSSEIHYLFFNLLNTMWDNTDADIPIMSNLIDAFASCVFSMFEQKKEKRTMSTLKKMVLSVRSTCQTADGSVSLADAIFAGIKDQESMPCKYFAQFKKAAGERVEEVEEKVATFFEMFTKEQIEMMDSTDEDIETSLRFKTAIFLNVVKSEEDEKTGNLLMILLNYYCQRIGTSSHVFFILDNLSANKGIISLPHWVQEANSSNITYLIGCNNLKQFQQNKRTEKYLNNLKKSVGAYLFVHLDKTSTNDEFIPYDREITTTVLIPSEKINVEDEF